jgi:two-component system, NarL family, captular synthesis response regulator RcsB
MINIVALDDHPMIIEGIMAKLMQQHILDVQLKSVVLVSVLEKTLIETKADILILDLDLQQQGNGLDLIQPLKKKFPLLKILVFTQRNQYAVYSTARQKGADGLVSKSESAEEILRAIRFLMENKTYYSPEVAQFFEPKNQMQFTMSEFEKDVLKALKTTDSQKEIADLLNKKPHTVKNALTALRHKFGVETTAQLYLEAYKQGFIF